MADPTSTGPVPDDQHSAERSDDRTDVAAAGDVPVRAPRRTGWRRVVRPLAVFVVAVFVVVFVVSNWDGVSDGLSRLTVGGLVVSLAAALVGVFASMLSWRAILRGAGSRLTVRASARIFFLSQLGKYVPGSIWPIVAQMELSQRYEVPKARVGFAALTQMLVGIATGSVVAAVALVTSSPDALSTYWWLPVVGLASLVALTPPVLDLAVRLAARVSGGRFSVGDRMTWRTVGASAAWGVVMWLAFGVHLWVMASELSPSGDRLLLLSTGGYALASVVGILIVILPAGAGAREAVLVLVFAGAMGREDALVIALVSRFLMLLADLLGAGVAVLAARRRLRVTG